MKKGDNPDALEKQNHARMPQGFKSLIQRNGDFRIREKGQQRDGVSNGCQGHNLIHGKFAFTPEIRPEKFRNHPPDLGHHKGFHKSDAGKALEEQQGADKARYRINHGGNNLDGDHFFTGHTRRISHFFGLPRKDHIKTLKELAGVGGTLAQRLAIAAAKA